MKTGDSFTVRYAVTEKIYNGFRDIFSDNNPLHTDIIFARSHGMPDIVMYGNILNGFISHFIGEVLSEKNVIIHSQSINFYKPVFLDDVVTLQAEITDVHEAVKAYGFKFIFRNQSGVRVSKGTIGIGLI